MTPMRPGLVILSLLVLPLTAICGVPEDIRELAKGLQASLPIQVDKDKQLETVVAVGNTLIFKYKVTDATVFLAPHFDTEKYTRALLASQQGSVCKEESTRDLLRRGAKFNYLMVGRDGQRFINYTLTNQAC
jgi:hypothetical protein